jgi:hypothetical protein
MEFLNKAFIREMPFESINKNSIAIIYELIIEQFRNSVS